MIRRDGLTEEIEIRSVWRYLSTEKTSRLTGW